jgi:ribonuclease BN (tRNA processing enzyme)
VTELVFLGTGNFLAPPGRYWNSFVMDTAVLVEPSPTALPNLRRCGFSVDDIEVVVISHFHADHCFGWPFFLEAATERGGGRTLSIVGPPGLEAHLADLVAVGKVSSVLERAGSRLDLRFVEVDGTWQEAGPLRFRAIEVAHVPYLRCFGYLFERDGGVVAYSGDTTPCAGLDELARESSTLVVECNGRHGEPGDPTSHMDEDSVRALQSTHPDVRLVLTHLGEQVDLAQLFGVTVPDDFARLTV